MDLELNHTFIALADPTRRAILGLLRDQPASIRELTHPFPMTQQAISKHIAVLKRAGLVEQRKEGRIHRCFLRPERLAEVAAWIQPYRELWEQRFDQLDDYLKQRRDSKMTTVNSRKTDIE